MNRHELLLKLPLFINRCKKCGYPVTSYQLNPAFPDLHCTQYILELNLGSYKSTKNIANQLSHIFLLLSTSLSPTDVDHIIAIHVFDANQNIRGILDTN